MADARAYLSTRLGKAQASCASSVFQYEAEWNPHATNASSGAYGLPQAYPKSKLGDWAMDESREAASAGNTAKAWLYAAWRDNPVVQAEWGVDYMIDRYGSACKASAFRSYNGWY